MTIPTEIPALPFQWVGGALCLDFTNTVSWNRDGPTEERLTSYVALVEWAVAADVQEDGARLLEAAGRRPRQAARVLERGLEVRRLLHGMFCAVAAGDPPGATDLVAFNAVLATATTRLEIRATPAHLYAWGWRGDDLESPLRPVVWSAAELLVSAEPVKRCANPDCGWLFVDRSRRGNRRWCDMRECGSRAKARRYYRRKKNRQQA